jgi:hypothetical protein
MSSTQDPEFVLPEVHVTELRSIPGTNDSEEIAISSPICDFCADVRVRWSYPCESFELQDPAFGSSDDWAACDRCSELIERSEFGKLHARSATSYRLRFGQIHTKDIEDIKRIQLGFIMHRCGEREAFG